MITLYQFPASRDLPSLSPYCLRVETYLKMAGIEYDNEFVRNPGKAPKGKLPYISDGGMLVADSTLIIDHLERVHNPNFGVELTEEQKNLSHALERMVMEYTCWSILWTRWETQPGWSRLGPLFFGAMPWYLKAWLPKMVRKKMISALSCQGFSRHSESEIKEILHKDLSVLSSVLGDKPYFLVTRPQGLMPQLFLFWPMSIGFLLMEHCGTLQTHMTI